MSKFTSKMVLGQYLNIEGTKMFWSTLMHNRRNFVPHLKIKSIRNVDWKKLNEWGIKYLIFDKDNTLTRPYERNYFSN